MADKMFIHRIHGHPTHDLAIFLAQRHLKNKGCILKDPDVFKKKYLFPGEPDIYFDYVEKGKKYTFIVEMESNPTKANTIKKTHQFKDSNSGITDMIIIDLSLCEHQDCISKFEKYIVSRLPV